MAIRNILKERNPEENEILRKKSRKVEKIDRRIIRLIDDMRDTLIESGGVGLAAPQVGILRRVVLVDNGDEILELINPEIIETEGKQEEIEGCLSVPGKWGITDRPYRVKVRALNRDGEVFEAEGVDLVARCFCHELDHLDGTLFIDKVVRFVTEDELEGDDDDE